LPYTATKNILLELIKTFDGEDRWYLETLGTDLQGHESSIYPEVLKMFGDNKPSTQWSAKMTMLAWRLHPGEAVRDLTMRATDPALPANERQNALTALSFVNNKAAADSMLALSKNTLPDVAEQAAYWLSFRQTNDWYSLLDWSKLDVNTGYQRKLAAMKVKKQIILDSHQSMNERKWRVQEMAEDSVGAQLLIGMASEKKLPEILLPFIEEKIFQNPDPTIRVQASQYFKRPGTDKIFFVSNITKLPADADKGKIIFIKNCSSCHKAAGEGNTIGPELTGIAKKFNQVELLDAIINPSAAIVFGYEPWLINTKDGSSLYGFLVAENKQTIVLKDVSGVKHVIDVSKISRKERQNKSLMPDPVTNGLTEQNLADIVAYLQHIAKTKS
jgi:putative heme-binding domain-containing protein